METTDTPKVADNNNRGLSSITNASKIPSLDFKVPFMLNGDVLASADLELSTL